MAIKKWHNCLLFKDNTTCKTKARKRYSSASIASRSKKKVHKKSSKAKQIYAGVSRHMFKTPT
jgi:hypothetical protein